MKVPERTRRRFSGANLTPMIDVVFLLIIFFVVSNTMMQNDVSKSVNLPLAEEVEDETGKETGKLIVNVDQSGALFYGARPVAQEELKGMLQKEKSLSQIPLEVRIRTDRGVPWATIEPVLVMCAESGIGDVSFSVLQK